MENVLRMMSYLVYQNKQYRSKKDLIEAIFLAASKIEKETILNLYRTFPNRLIKLVENRGKRIDY